MNPKISFPWSRLIIGGILASVFAFTAAVETMPVESNFLGCVARTSDPEAYGIRDHETHKITCISPRQLREAGLIP